MLFHRNTNFNFVLLTFSDIIKNSQRHALRMRVSVSIFSLITVRLIELPKKTLFEGFPKVCQLQRKAPPRTPRIRKTEANTERVEGKRTSIYLSIYRFLKRERQRQIFGIVTSRAL